MSSVNRDSLSKRDERGHPGLFADLKGKASVFSPVSAASGVGSQSVSLST